MQDISYTVHTFREGPTYIAYAPELDVSSCGATSEDAQRNIRDAVQGFLEASSAMGTLDEVLQESGYTRSAEGWEPPEFVALERQKVSVA